MRLRPGVAIDLGTVNTLVSVTGRGLVIEEPSAIAVDRATSTMVAIGHEADDFGRADSAFLDRHDARYTLTVDGDRVYARMGFPDISSEQEVAISRLVCLPWLLLFWLWDAIESPFYHRWNRGRYS